MRQNQQISLKNLHKPTLSRIKLNYEPKMHVEKHVTGSRKRVEQEEEEFQTYKLFESAAQVAACAGRVGSTTSGKKRFRTRIVAVHHLFWSRGPDGEAWKNTLAGSAWVSAAQGAAQSGGTRIRGHRRTCAPGFATDDKRWPRLGMVLLASAPARRRGKKAASDAGYVQGHGFFPRLRHATRPRRHARQEAGGAGAAWDQRRPGGPAGATPRPSAGAPRDRLPRA
jgi:hypothetical protein